MPVGFSSIGAEAFEAFRKGDRKRAYDLQKTMCEIPPEELSHRSSICFYKEAARQLGLDVGLPRRPSDRLTEAEKKQVSVFLAAYSLDKLKLEKGTSL